MLYLNGKSKKSNLQRFQCLLQRIVFDAGIGDAVLKNSANVTILKSLIYLSFLIATASMIFFLPFSVDVNYTLFFFCVHWLISNSDDFASDKQFSIHMFYIYIYFHLCYHYYFF